MLFYSLAATPRSPSTCLRLPSWFITRCSAAWSILSDLFLAASVWRTSAKVSIPVLIVLQTENGWRKTIHYFIYVARAATTPRQRFFAAPRRKRHALPLLASSTR